MATKAKPILVVSKSKFIKFMMYDDDAINIETIKKHLKKKSNFSLEDMIKNCKYLPNDVIKNRVDYKLRDSDEEYFEVNPKNFTIVLI